MIDSGINTRTMLFSNSIDGVVKLEDTSVKSREETIRNPTSN